MHPGVLVTRVRAFINSYFVTAGAGTAPETKLDADALSGILGGHIPEEPDSPAMALNAFPRDNDKTNLRDARKCGECGWARLLGI